MVLYGALLRVDHCAYNCTCTTCACTNVNDSILSTCVHTPIATLDAIDDSYALCTDLDDASSLCNA
jgi:hypothetical protein